MFNIHDYQYYPTKKDNGLYVTIQDKQIECRDFPNEFKDYYYILENGMVLSKTTFRIRRQYVPKGSRYLQIVVSSPLKRATLNTHRIVALAFVPNLTTLELSDLQVNHIDGNCINNYYTNLEWVTREDNIRHAKQLGKLNDISEEIVREIRLLRGVNSAQELCDLYGISVASIYGIWLNKSYKDKNYVPPTIRQSGTFNSRSKFTEADIDFIRSSDLSVQQLADLFETKSTTISKIRLNLRYVDPTYVAKSSRKNITVEEIRQIRQLAETNSITEVCQLVERPYMYVYKIVTRRMYADVI